MQNSPDRFQDSIAMMYGQIHPPKQNISISKQQKYNYKFFEYINDMIDQHIYISRGLKKRKKRTKINEGV